MTELDQRAITTIRFLSADMVEKAKSGHPGTPMGAAAIVYTLWSKFLQHNPANPNWVNRDRFVLSPGHASALLYSLLHLTGYNLDMEELKEFRQWGSRTPGHPEHGLTAGVEITTGPLGQGFAHGVGMAIAERWLANHYNTNSRRLIDHFTYALVSDGDLQEGVSAEAASLAGNLKLGKLIYLYDDNGIQIEGSTDVSFTEDVAKRFESYDWQVLGPIDGNDPDEISRAIRSAREETNKPTLIICTTHIGFGAPNKQGTASAHGEPLGSEEVASAKKLANWPPEPFHVPDEVAAHMRSALVRGKSFEKEWEREYNNWRDADSRQAEKFDAAMRGDLPTGWNEGLSEIFSNVHKPVSTRDASGKVLNFIISKLQSLAGGSADLAPSTKTYLNGHGDFSAEDYGGHNFHFGVREHAMGSIVNGMALHGGIIPYAATFLVFSDYMRPAVRLAALMGLRVIFVFTHDSIGLGEDGPTHQPIEHLLALRAIPNLTVFRTADATETAEAWQAAIMNQNGPTALVLSRQNLPILDRNVFTPAAETQKGGYVLWESENDLKLIIIGTGSETHIALEAGRALAQEGMGVRVVSLPSWEAFDRQSAEYRESVLPARIRSRISIEAATPLGWEHYIGLDGIVIGIDHFGASAPAEVLYKEFGITVENVIKKAHDLVINLGGQQ